MTAPEPMATRTMMATISALDRAVEALERLERLANATEPVPDGTLEDALLEVAQRMEDPRLTSPVGGDTALGCWGVFRADARQDGPWRLTWADKKRPRIEDKDEHRAKQRRRQNARELGFARQSIACRAQEAREWLFRLRAEIEAAHEAVPKSLARWSSN